QRSLRELLGLAPVPHRLREIPEDPRGDALEERGVTRVRVVRLPERFPRELSRLHWRVVRSARLGMRADRLVTGRPLSLGDRRAGRAALRSLAIASPRWRPNVGSTPQIFPKAR